MDHKVKWGLVGLVLLGSVTLAQCRELAQQALKADTAAAVRELLARALPLPPVEAPP